MDTQYFIRANRVLGKRDSLLYGHFIEHFHRQIYGGVYDPQSRFADEDGLRVDVMDAMRKIHIPILRWPGGCFVSSYHWQKAVGPERIPFFDKAWRVEDPNSFGTNEFVLMCKKLGCEPYICTNAGTGSAEEMSDWLEYCNLANEGEFARLRIEHGYEQPHNVKYWSIGNENYGAWEIGAKDAADWGRLVLESAKMMKHVDPTAELSAAALADLDWNLNLLKCCGQHIDWISIHKYWDQLAEMNDFANYAQVMAYTNDLDTDIRKVRGLLMAMGLEKRIKIAYDEWNLRGWHHPKVHSIPLGISKDSYLTPRDLNDRNSDYTMADAIFTACFLNTLNRNCDIVGMANFAPIVNTRGCIFTHPDGLVLRSTYHIFDLYVNYLGDEILDSWIEKMPCMEVTGKEGVIEVVDVLDVLATRQSGNGRIALAAINKHPNEAQMLNLHWEYMQQLSAYRVISVKGDNTEAYNDINCEQVRLVEGDWQIMMPEIVGITLEPHSANVVQFR